MYFVEVTLAKQDSEGKAKKADFTACKNVNIIIISFCLFGKRPINRFEV